MYLTRPSIMFVYLTELSEYVLYLSKHPGMFVSYNALLLYFVSYNAI